MKIIVEIDITEEEYKQAIVDGWLDRYEEVIETKDIGTFDSVEDFMNATRVLDFNDSFVNIHIKK